ncbi:PAS domain-containing protein [Candidatus Parcubacteria bacterium]|nr:PAS domain-containing protein [Candidatus Parcubacteria bacterium]
MSQSEKSKSKSDLRDLRACIAEDFHKEGELQKYNMLFTGNPVPMAIIELPSRKFTEVNAAFLNRLQYKESGIIGKAIMDIGLFDDQEKQKKIADVLEKKGHIRNLDLKIRANTGEILNVIFSGEVFESQGKNFFSIVIMDVTEHKRNIKEIRSKTEQISRDKSKIETIIQSIGDGVFVVDNNLRIILINPVASQLSGYSEKEALNQKYSKILRFVLESDPQKENSDFITQTMDTGEIQSMPRHTMLISREGEKIPVADSVVPLKNKQGKIIGCVVVFRDATREREIDRMKSEFVSLASHQLKTPMTGIKWMSELMLREHLSDKQKEYMHDIHESTNRTIGLVDDLLNLSRMETGGQFNVVKKRIDLDKIFKEIIENNREFAEFKKVDIKYKKNSPKLILNIDRNKIKHALNNIFNNSIKYSRDDNGKVLADIRKKDNEILIKIKDNGIGIPTAQQKKIFEKFFRADNAQYDTIGTGLGLSISKSIIEAHGGQIWFESKKDSGAIFYVKLPLK